MVLRQHFLDMIQQIIIIPILNFERRERARHGTLAKEISEGHTSKLIIFPCTRLKRENIGKLPKITSNIA